MSQPDTAGPTPERLRHAGASKTSHGDFEIGGGREKSSRRYAMLDDALGRAWRRSKISGEEYASLKRYALHWVAGGLQGPMQSVDLNRIYAFDPSAMSGLAKTERQQDHRDAYRAARSEIGYCHPEIAFVADQVACFDYPVMQVGLMLGYHSVTHAREAAGEILRGAGYRLVMFWRDRDRER